MLRLGVPPTLARSLRSTNPIESMIEICREHAKNVKNWRDGQMALRWAAAGMIEAGKQFRRVNGHLHLPALRAALEPRSTTTSSDPVRTKNRSTQPEIRPDATRRYPDFRGGNVGSPQPPQPSGVPRGAPAREALNGRVQRDAQARGGARQRG
jgi:hypothetical protein